MLNLTDNEMKCNEKKDVELFWGYLSKRPISSISSKGIVIQLGHRESFHQRPMKHCLTNYAWGNASVDKNIAPCSSTLFHHSSVYSSEKTR